MGYVFHTPPHLSSAARKSFWYRSEGGVDYRADAAASDEGKASEICNLWPENGVLTACPAFEKIGNRLPGKLHTAHRFGESALLHIGTVLYRFSERQMSVLLEDLPDVQSIPVEFAGKLYLYCGARIFCTDRSFEAAEVFPLAPLYRKDCSSTMDTGVYINDFKPNILAPYVAITYYEENRVNGASGYRFPRDMDKTRGFEVYFEDRLLDKSEYTVSDTKFNLNTLSQTEKNSVKLCYYSTEKKLDHSEMLSGCTVGAAFGGGTLEGTRVFLAGNPAYPGRYFTGELAEPCCFYEDSGGTVGESAGNITGFSKQQGDMLVFTENSVSRMSYHYASGQGGYFSVKSIHTETGCDMPGSIALADNRTVFASTSGGVYLVDSTELFDGMNLVPISRNISDAARKTGFFSVDAADLRKARACVFGRKYILSAGGKAFVWDFETGAYAGGRDYDKAARKLAWFELDVPADGSCFAAGKELYRMETDETGVQVAGALPQGEGKTPFVFGSCGCDLGAPQVNKTATGLAFSCRTAAAAELALEFYADGRRYRRVNVRVSPEADGAASVYVRLPRVLFERFRFRITGENAGLALYNLRVDYLISDKQRLW